MTNRRIRINPLKKEVVINRCVIQPVLKGDDYKKYYLEVTALAKVLQEVLEEREFPTTFRQSRK